MISGSIVIRFAASWQFAESVRIRAYSQAASDCWKKSQHCYAVMIARGESFYSGNESLHDTSTGPDSLSFVVIFVAASRPHTVTHFVLVERTSRLVTCEPLLRSALSTSDGSSVGPATAHVSSFTSFNSCNTTCQLFGFLISEAVKNREEPHRLG